MTKVVYNACFGGFSLSDAAIRRYAEIAGFPLYIEKDARFSSLTIYYRVPKEQRVDKIDWNASSLEERKAYNAATTNETFYDRNLDRTDPILVQVVEELGDAANGDCAKLRIAEIPAGSQYRIDEYDGNESVETPDSYEWHTA